MTDVSRRRSFVPVATAALFAMGSSLAIAACAQLQGLDGFEKVECLDDCADGGGGGFVDAPSGATDVVKPGVDAPSAPPVDAAPPKECTLSTDCTSGVCTVESTCAAPTCTDKVKNGTEETDVDCGGSGACPKCGDGKKCLTTTDCSSGICDVGTKLCAPTPTCTDNIKNGTETAIDCGGTCAKKCALGQTCATSVDCDNAICGASLTCRTATSCSEIKNGIIGATNGLHTIAPNGVAAPYSVYCDMTGDGGGWTLALKADGAKTTFTYDATLWTNATLLNEGMPNLDLNEAKLQPWNDIAFTALRVGIVDATVTRWLVITKTATSLQALMAAGSATTAQGRDAWKALMVKGSLQPFCNAEGFSMDPTASSSVFAKVRIGILGNQENDCTSPDSWIGIGGYGAPCGPQPPETSVGNIAGCTPDNGDVNVPAFGYVMVR